MRILVTGGSGLVGGHLAARLASEHEVHTIDRHERAPAGVTAHVAELTEAPALAAVVARVRPEVTVHAAYSMADLDRDVVAASVAVVDACREAGSDLVHLSSDAVFGGSSAPYGEHDVPHGAAGDQPRAIR